MLFAIAGVALIVVAICQNNHTSDGHHYWPFMDLFGLFVLGCALIVFALNAVVWSRLVRAEASRSSMVVALFLLMVLSPGATILLAVLILLLPIV